ncbi:ABC transporter ATP-binding protein [Shinella sp.]|uniref:ABC transporter ATP-binding protein n=1 Tax=Shinella sp. TaxID=1870904 RepID=UPI0039E3F301
MMKALLRLLADDAAVFRRYLSMAVLYGVLSGATIAAVAPALASLLLGEGGVAARWLVVLLAGVTACWLLRRRVEKAGIGVGIAVLGGARQRIGDHVARLPVGWFSSANTARLAHVVTHGMMEIAQLPAHVVTPLVSGAVAPLVLVFALFALDARIRSIALVTLPLMAGIFLFSARLGRAADAAYQQSAAETSQRTVEFAQAQSVLRAFNGEGGGLRFLEEAIDRQHRAGRRLIWLSTLATVLNVWALQAVFAAFLIAVATRLPDAVSAPEAVGLLAAMLLAIRFVDPLLDVAAYGSAVRGARNQLDAVDRILAERPLPEPADPRRPRDASVELHDVSFCYRPEDADVLHGVSLSVEPGSMVALVGASGSGKTTLLRLIARFFDVDAGRVLVGGVDIRDMRTEDLSAQISQIFQENWLFEGSIADNIRIGRPAATDEEIREAAHLAGVEEIATRLPDGFDTIVGEGGARLSGGERQRVAVARGLIKDAPILLVDEATAALDAENQQVVARTLSRLRGKRTLIVIAHQLSTVRMADAVVVLEGGRVAEAGTPASLEAMDGLYRRFLRQRRAAKGWRIGAGT